MKKLLIATCMLLGFAGIVSAQQTASKQAATNTTEMKVEKKMLLPK